MDKIQKLGMLFNELASELNISATDYDRAVTAYNALGKFIKEKNKYWDVRVYPQGSFELGTVIKPISDEDQYDVDLVIEITSPVFDAHVIRTELIALLESYGRYEERVEEKNPCLRITYADSAQFHMDLACAIPHKAEGTVIHISRKNAGEGTYYYDDSNPLGYIEWFKKCMQFELLLQEQKFFDQAETQVEKLSLQKSKLPLQKAIQILKRHRDIFFKDDLDNRPSSIIITTLCGLSYDSCGTYKSITETFSKNDQSNVYLIIKEMLKRFPLFTSNDSQLEFNLSNPSLPSENFLKKWNENPNLKKAFDLWYKQAQIDIIDNPEYFIVDNPKRLRESFESSFGSKSSNNALKKYGEMFGAMNLAGTLNIDTSSMSATVLQEGANIVKPKPNTFYGD